MPSTIRQSLESTPVKKKMMMMMTKWDMNTKP
jgi:hypothetical protein